MRIQIAKGKTKKVFYIGNGLVRILSKDDITAGDGEKKDVIPDKGKIATTTTCNCFTLLNIVGIPTHFKQQIGDDTFEAYRVDMIPIEVVIRRVATGSYLKRYPGVAEGAILDYPVELFHKDDENHDPFMHFDFERAQIAYYNPKKPVGDDFLLRRESLEEFPISLDGDLIGKMRVMATQVFQALEKAWASREVTLVDLKIEFGITLDGRLVVADVIDNDSWRIWPGGDKAQMKDKEVYRGLAETTPEALGKIKENYAWVADQTWHFLKI